MRKQTAPRLLAVLLSVWILVMPVLATYDNSLDFYEAVMNSQGTTGSVNLESVNAEILPDDVENVGGSTVVTDISSTTTGTESTGTTTDTSTDTTTDTSTDTTTDTSADAATGTTTDATTDTSADTTTDTTTDTPTETESEDTVVYTVKEVSISTQYNTMYDLYELSAGGHFYVYTNASNGDIRSEGVYLDIPADVSYSLKKDGVMVDYTNKSTVNDLGSYYFTFIYTNEGTLTQYVANYRFRIEEAVVTEVPDTGYTDMTWDIYDMEAPDTTADDSDLDLDFAYDLEEPVDSDLDTIPEITLSDETEVSWDEDQYFSCNYDEESGYYKYTLRTGSYFYVNMPNGMISNGQATVYAGSNTINYEVYKDGVLYEDFVLGTSLRDNGTYSIVISEDTTDYWVSYVGMDDPIVTFTITDGSANHTISVFTVPQLMTVTGITLDGVELDITSGESHYYLSEDGVYVIEMDSPINSQALTLTKDTEPPSFTVTSTGNVVTIGYQSDDVADCILSSDGVVISSGTWVTEVSEPGDYTLTVVDVAGNSTTQNFSVNYTLNAAAILAVVLIAMVLLSAILVYRRFSTKATVL